MNGKLQKTLIVYMLIAGLMVLGGCGDKEDKLVMITTERSSEEGTMPVEQTASVEQTTLAGDGIEQDVASKGEEGAEDEAVTEAPSDEEKNITLNDIYNANTGDNLLANGNTGCSKNTIYYSKGSEIYSEFKFMGFDENGLYMQAYEDSEGKAEVLDNYNQCWYVLENNQLSTLIYPEEGVAAYMISYEHNNMIFSADDGSDEEKIEDIYRRDGSLVVETSSIADEEGKLTYQYVLSDDLIVNEIYCYDEAGEKISYSWITLNAVYNTPDIILDIVQGNVQTRMLNIKYPSGDGLDNIFFVPKEYPVILDLLQYKAYADEECTTDWYDNETGEDETIYLSIQ